MIQIAYFSTASAPQSAELLDTILAVSRTNNQRHSISGLLVAGGNRYMQVIEGPRLEMQSLWSAIRADDRHCGVTRLLKRTVPNRSFESWSMAFRREAGLAGFDSFPQTLRFLVQNVEDKALRCQIQLFARSFIAENPELGPNPWERSSA